MSNEEANQTLVKPLIAENLPSQFIYDLGLYLQTCAHIELAICSLICTIEHKTFGSPAFANRFHALRKLPQKDLLKALKPAMKKVRGADVQEIDSLLQWIDRYKQNRHIAAHGAYFVEEATGSIRVLYTHIKQIGGETVYQPEETTLTRNLVSELISNADRILRIFIGLRILVENCQNKT